jgi:hypothetical protein
MSSRLTVAYPRVNRTQLQVVGRLDHGALASATCRTAWQLSGPLQPTSFVVSLASIATDPHEFVSINRQLNRRFPLLTSV